MTHSRRKVGLEFEVCGQHRSDGQDIIENAEVYRKGWRCKDDGSIPEICCDGNCDCDRSLLCGDCDEPFGDCNCCYCEVTCPGCARTESVSAWLDQEETFVGRKKHHVCPNRYWLNCQGSIWKKELTAVKENCACGSRINFDNRSYTPDCDCDDTYDGYEIVSPPGQGNDFWEDAKVVYERIIQRGKDLRTPFRDRDGGSATGFHVHCDASDLTMQHIGIIGMWFAQNTDYLVSRFPDAIPEWRTTFNYCMPLTNRDEWSLARMIDYNISNEERYKSVNLRAKHKHGTVEYRIAYMPSSPETMLEWVRFCQFITDCAAQIPAGSFDVNTPAKDTPALLQAILEKELAPPVPEQIAA